MKNKDMGALNKKEARQKQQIIVLLGAALLITALIICSLATISIPLRGSSSMITEAFLERVTASFNFASIPEDILLAFISGVRCISSRYL